MRIPRWIGMVRVIGDRIDPRVILLVDGQIGPPILLLSCSLSGTMRKTLRTVLFLSLLSTIPAVEAIPGAPDGTARVEVSCTRSSAFVNVSINSDRPIGKVVIEVVDAEGRTWYKEEGKALTPELIRRLDKGGFPRSAMTLKVTAKDFEVSRAFKVE